ncbi:uncharacterized protein METZ01_LOCUS223536, partial [marine metagenome]
MHIKATFLTAAFGLLCHSALGEPSDSEFLLNSVQR